MLLILQEIANLQNLWKILVSNAMFNILQEILQSYLCLMSQKFEMQSFEWYWVKWITPIFGNKGKSGHMVFCKKVCKIIFFWCHGSLKCRVANGTESNPFNPFLGVKGKVDKRNNRKGLGHLIIISSSSHFNKTDLEQFFLNLNPYNKKIPQFCFILLN